MESNDGDREMDDSSVPSHLFVELTSLAELSFPTTASSRIKYTCVGASPHILAVGSSSGTVYLFSRYAAKNRKSLCNVPVQVIPCQEGAITLVEISPDEKSVAVATSRGFVCVLNISRNYSTMVLNSVLHVGSEITCFRFSLNSSRLFAGDSLGRISCSKLSSKLTLRSPCELILRLDSRVVQIDNFHAQLLLSTLSRCYLHNLARQTTSQIGSKLRNGPYGACFFNNDLARDNHESSMINGGAMDNGYSPLIFCARPGGRLWEVDGQGKVYSTHQFGSIKSIWGIAGFREFGVTSMENATSVSFGSVNVVSEFILSAGGRTLTLVDPKRGKLVLVADAGDDIAQFVVCTNDIFLLTVDGYLRKVTLFPLEKAIEKLHYRERYNAAGQVVCAVNDIEKTYRFRLDVLKDVRAHLDGLPESVLLAQKLDAIIAVASTRSDVAKVTRVPQVARLASGIHKVVKGMENSGYEDDFTFRMPAHRRGERTSRDRTSSRSPYSSLTRRSKSASSVKNFTLASASGGNGDFEDVPLNGELENMAQKVTAAFSTNDGDFEFDDERSDFPAVADYSMNISRSEESLVAILDDRSDGYNNENFNGIKNDGNVGASHSQATYAHPPSSRTNQYGMRSASMHEKANGNGGFVDNSPLFNDPLSITPEMLKQTGGKILKTGGKFLMEAVQKMSLLNIGPDYGDPAFMLDGSSNGFFDNGDDEAAETSMNDLTPTAADVSFDQGLGNDDDDSIHAEVSTMDKPMAETPVVQRVIRSGAGGRTRRSIVVKGGGKSNGHAATVKDGIDGGRANVEGQLGVDRPRRPLVFPSADIRHTVDETDQAIVTPTVEPARKLRCENCNLHNTWRFVLTLGPIANRIGLELDDYKDGGIPIDRESWKDLISEWKRLKLTSASTSHLCSDCGQLFASWFYRHDTLDSKTDDVVKGGSRTTGKTFERYLAEIPTSSLDRIFNGWDKRSVGDNSSLGAVVGPNTIQCESSEANVTGGRSDESGMAVSMYYNPLYESVYNAADGEDVEDKNGWQWLSGVSLDVLLAICAKVLGIEAALELLNEIDRELLAALSGSFYRLISSQRKTISPSNEVLRSIAADVFGLKDIISAGSDSKVDEVVRIDARDFCPCCTLPLTSAVGENDQRILIFACGHSYHNICLSSHAKPPYSCLVCTVIST